MGNVHKLISRQSATEEAGLWLSKLSRGLSQQETAQLQDWLAKDVSHQRVFLAMAKAWDDMSSLEVLADLFPNPAPARSERLLRYAAAAGVVAVACFVGWLVVANIQSNPDRAVLVQENTEPTELTYDTGVGEQSTTVLADGTTVVLNTDSLIAVRYSSHHRILELVRGEVHVDVVPNRRRPLTVIARENIVQAVGTAFVVQLVDDSKAELVVIEGAVLVGTTPKRLREKALIAAVPILPITALRVSQGEELLMGEESANVRAVTPDDIEARISWKEGNLVFRDERLEDALKEVERYTNLRFSFADQSLKSQLLTGRYRAGDIDSFLVALGESHDISYEWTDESVVLLDQL